MPEQPAISVTIDGVQVQVPKGTLLVEAAKQIRRDIPVYCYHPKMGPAGLCRICLVEIEGMPKLQIACNTQAADGMVVHTQSPKAADGRRAVLELYLVNHPLDCPICDKGGECDLQDYAMAYGQGYSRSADAKESKPKAVDLGPTIVLDEERCVVCQRCVRFDDMLVGERQLVLKDRGVHDIIATATGTPYRHNFTGNVTELCPVGALTSKTYRFKSRPWDLRRTRTSCTQCPVGCQMLVDVRHGNVARTMSVENDHDISDGWLCDRGRYNTGFYADKRRLTQPLFKRNGQWLQISWDEAFSRWADAIKTSPERAGVIGGGRLTNEEAFLLQHVFRSAGVKNVDWRSGSQTQASPGKNAAKIADLESASAIILVGESPAERAPILDLRVRKAAFQKHAKLIRIASLERPYPPPIGAVDVADVRAAVEALPKDAQRIAVVWDGVDRDAVTQLLSALPKSAAILTYICSEQGNARGAEAMGVLPHFGPGYASVTRGMDSNAILRAACDGKLSALSLFGVNPLLNYSDGILAREALERAAFVAVSELFMTQTAEIATLVLPAKGAFEKTGTSTNLAGDLLPVDAAHSLQSPPDALTDLEMLIGLAEQLGVPVPSAEDVEQSVIRALAVTPPFDVGDDSFAMESRDGDRKHTPARQTDAPSHFSVVTQSNIFSGGGTSAHDEQIAGLRPLPQVALSVEDAAELKLKTGDYVDLQSGATTMHDLLVEVRAGISRGSLALAGGLPDDPANIFAEGAQVAVENVR